VTVFHRVLGTVIVLLFVVIVVTGLVLRVTGRRETPAALWAVQHWTENLLIVQTVVGIVLLLMGRRAVGDGIPWFHYLYGSLFPLIAVVGGRLAGLRREDREYVGLVWGAFFAFGLTLRAIQTGCGPEVSLLRCIGL
jgi:cytochrome bd-type quinol oxidase subunit 2